MLKAQTPPLKGGVFAFGIEKIDMNVDKSLHDGIAFSALSTTLSLTQLFTLKPRNTV
jgi:hypothetical protein